MIAYPQMDPVAFRLGPLAVHWYGLMYLLGFWGSWWLGVRRGRLPHINWPAARVTDLLFYVVLGVILGGRIGYTLFYNFEGFAADPLVILRMWEGGMSFHGGLLGVIGAYVLFAWHQKLRLTEVADFAAPLIPFGLFTGRIGNFINAELWGKPTDLPWAMVFPGAGPEPRHPSMLYEAGLEGPILLLILWWYGSRQRPPLAVSGLFLVLYGTFRFGVEFVRLPDKHIGYLAWDWLTMGQVLSLPMIVVGAGMLAWGYSTSRQPRSRAS